MTEGRILSACCLSFAGIFLTTVSLGERFFKPPNGNLGAPMVNIRNSLFCSSENSVRISKKFTKVWLLAENPCIGVMFSLRYSTVQFSVLLPQNTSSSSEGKKQLSLYRETN